MVPIIYGAMLPLKEYFLPDCTREDQQVISSNPADFSKGKDKFFGEARILARFNHHNIVKVITVFEENNTAYMVMEIVKGPYTSTISRRTGRIKGRRSGSLHTTN